MESHNMNATEKKVLAMIYAQDRYWFIGSLAETLDIGEGTTRKYVKSLAKKGLILLTKSMGEFKFQGYHTLRSYLGMNGVMTVRTTITIEECDKRIQIVEQILKEKRNEQKRN